MQAPDWYGKADAGKLRLLTPLSWLYGLIVVGRRRAYRNGWFKVHRLPVPVIIVGNITAGGTGKTPFTAWLAAFLAHHGYHPGIISRGYGGRSATWPQAVFADSDPLLVGDEPVLLARNCRCPVSVGPNRPAAARALLERAPCDVLISDDGLQHYALGRDIEIALIDGERRLGNGRYLPAGPLRESAARLSDVDMVVVNGDALVGEYAMHLHGTEVRAVRDERIRRPLASFLGIRVHALAGIGHPQRFFNHLRAADIDFITHALADHHRFTAEDICFEDGAPVLMTEKDAVKCRRFAGDQHWFVPVVAAPALEVGDRLLTLLRRTQNG